jgi:hypothetical protein
MDTAFPLVFMLMNADGTINRFSVVVPVFLTIVANSCRVRIPPSVVSLPPIPMQ